MEEKQLEILKELDKATNRGISYIENYLREHGGILNIDGKGDSMYAIIYNDDMECNIEVKITGLRLDVTEEEPKGELELELDYPYNDWVNLYDDIYILPTVQSILEAITDYK